MTNQTKQHIIYSFLGLFLLASVFSCGNRRHEKDQVKLERKNDKELKAALFSKEKIPFHFMSGRVGVNFKSKDLNASFSVYVKLKVDTAIGGTIKAGPIVIGTYKITTDSIIFVNKREKCYFAENLDYVSVLFGTEIEFDFFQDLILGLAVGLDHDIKYKQINAKDHYILSSHKERDFKRLEHDRLNNNKDKILKQYHLDRENLDVFRINIEIPADTASITINYLERKMVGDIAVPEETTLEIVHPNDSIFIHLNYGTIKINEPKQIKIKIPSTYSECK